MERMVNCVRDYYSVNEVHIKVWEHVLAELDNLSLPFTSFWLS